MAKKELYTLYEKFAIGAGTIYISLYAAVAYPKLFVFLQSFFGGNSLVEQNSCGFRSLLTMVAPIGFIYIFGAYYHLTSLIDLTIAWRLLWVGPWLYINSKTSGLEQSATDVIAALDLGIPIIAIISNWPMAIGIPSRILEHFRKPALTFSRVLLLWIGRIGIALVIIIASNVAKSKDQSYVQSFYISVMACYYLFFDWFARSENTSVGYFTGFIELVLITNILVIMFVYGEHEQVALQAMLSFACFTTLAHFYAFAWDIFVIKDKWSYGWWAFNAMGVVTILSLIFSLFMPLYSDLARLKATGKHRQDLIFAGFVSLVGYLLEEIRGRAPKLAALNAFFLPFCVIWYSGLSNLMVINSWGTPFHPSWLSNQLVPALYSGKVIVDFTFSLGAVLVTGVATNLAAVTLLLYLQPTRWLWLCFNGLLLVAVSANWMIIATSGLPSLTPHFPIPAIPSIIPLHTGPQLKGAIKTHVRDLILAIMSILAGLFLHYNVKLAGDEKEKDYIISRVVFFIVTMTWSFLVIPKIYLYHDIHLV